MPLFDSIESDVAAFFVSQGSVFDALVKSFMDRVARIEARVETLAFGTNESLQSISQQMQLLSAAADAHAAATLAQLEQVSQTAAAMAAMAAAATASASADQHSNDLSDTTSTTDTRSTRDPLVYSHEVEYYIMTLARQLHVVLELFFQPHGPDNVEDVQSTEARFANISDVLTLNEAIIMQLSAANAPEPSAVVVGRVPIEPILEGSDEDARSDVASEEESVEGPDNDESHMKDDDALHHHEDATDDDLSEFTTGRPDTLLPSDSSLASAIVPGISTEPARPPRSRKKSLYDSFRDFHERQLSEEERERFRETEWLRKVEQMLATAKKHWRDEVAAAVTLAWQEKIRELESHQMKLQSEWKYLQEQQRPHDLLLQQQQHQQQELDRQVAVLSESLLAAQLVQKQQLADVIESLRAFQDQYVSKAEFSSTASVWLQTARDECVFGVNADALVALKHEMEAFHAHLVATLASETSPLLEQLLGEVNRVLELLTQLLELLSSDGAGWYGVKGFETMQTLRTFLTGLDNLTQSVESDRGESVRSAAFMSETLRQMELGAANLLEAFETQQDRYQHAFEQQQRAIDQLQVELRDQRGADAELKRRLAGCPSQEDTLHVIQELRSQIDASASDSAARMLETVDKLHARMGGLPSAEIVERLAQSIQKKADRAEMDRLEKLLAAANSGMSAPVGSLMKAPMKCLSCDQSLPKQRELNASFTPNNWLESHAAHMRPSFVNLDDGRNRIPLRRTVLSDQVVYGPVITPNAFKRRAFASALSRFDSYDQQGTLRPKTAIAPERRGGEVITRSVSSTVVIRPFAEQATHATPSDKQRTGKF